MGLPSFDLAPFSTDDSARSASARSTAAAMDEALRSVGFFTVTGHGIDAEVRSRYFAAMREFFALPPDEKERIAIGNSRYHRGYVGFGTEALDGALGGRDDDAIGTAPVGDLKETLDTGLDHGPGHPEFDAGTPLHGPNQWPDLPGFRPAVEAYRSAAIAASERTHRALAVALGLDPAFFETFAGETMYHLRLVHYPPTDRMVPAAGQLGCGAHTDYGTVTLLATDGVPGLEVQQRSGEWIDVDVADDALVVNLGDLMAIWTNDRWISNPHRVIPPAERDRYSSPLFVEPPYHTRIEALPGCVPVGERPRHEPLVVGRYLLSRFDGTHAYRTPTEGGTDSA